MTDLTNVLGVDFRPPKQRIVDPPEAQLLDAIRDSGLEPPDEVVIDGKFHRFGRKKASWYVAYSDNVPAGMFGCWREDLSQKWSADIGRSLTAIEHMAMKQHHARARAEKEADRKRRYEVTGEVVKDIWANGATASPDHPYLTRKGIQPHGARVTGDGRLIVPLYKDGKLATVQYISEDGSKLYHAGGATKGATWQIGSDDDGGALYVAEGFATAASIHEATGQPCIVTYSANNIVPAVEQIRNKDRMRDIVIVADNDRNGVGKRHADEAAKYHGARVVMMPNEGEDANDYAQAGGDLVSLLAPQPSGWLIQADEFSTEPAPIQWLIKHWLQRHGLVMIHGPSGSGKTFVVLDMLLHVASNQEKWNGEKVRPGPVVYLAGEGHHGMRARIAAWKHHHKVKSLDMWISRAGTDLNTSEGLAYARESIQALPHPPAVISVDTLHRFLHGDENSAQDAKSMIDACSALQSEFGCTVMLVHHTGVSEEAQHRARGSSAWRGALDIEISIQPPKTGDGPLACHQRKMKDGELAESLYFDLERVEIPGWFDEDGEPVASAVISRTDPPKPGRPTAHQEWVRYMRQAWHRGEREMVSGQPYVSRSVLRDTLIEAGLTTGTVKKYMQAGSGKMIGQLLESGIICDSENGWLVKDPAICASWVLEQ